MPLSDSPVPDIKPKPREPRFRNSDMYMRAGRSPDPLPKGAKELRKEAERLLASTKEAWRVAAEAKSQHEAEKRRFFDRIDRLTKAQEHLTQEFTSLREEVKKLTQASKK